MRGEDSPEPSGKCEGAGAPPRAWGGLRQIRQQPLDGRSTPTCVGRTCAGTGPSTDGAEHPHVRGEDSVKFGTLPAGCGAPPRAWGGRCRGRRAAAHVGSTPTCVGRTGLSTPSTSRAAEHPHVRGEDAERPAVEVDATGAPPRAWGGRTRRRNRRRDQRRAPPRAWGGRWSGPAARGRSWSTPTCVGRTATWCGVGRPRSEHPHVRGEDHLSAGYVRRRHGAPPRAWGGQLGIPVPHLRTRSTPTCVGRTGDVPRWRPAAAEHPHVRGEDRWTPVGAASGSGAPPRAWGGRRPGRRRRRAGRSTPTCVGRTSTWAIATGASAEHPHVRGEDSAAPCRVEPMSGAPPRAWGGHFATCGFIGPLCGFALAGLKCRTAVVACGCPHERDVERRRSVWVSTMKRSTPGSGASLASS